MKKKYQFVQKVIKWWINVYLFLFLKDFMSGIKTKAPDMSRVRIKGPSICSEPTSIM